MKISFGLQLCLETLLFIILTSYRLWTVEMLGVISMTNLLLNQAQEQIERELNPLLLVPNHPSNLRGQVLCLQNSILVSCRLYYSKISECYIANGKLSNSNASLMVFLMNIPELREATRFRAMACFLLVLRLDPSTETWART